MARENRTGSRWWRVGCLAAFMVVALPHGAHAQILEIVQNIQAQVGTAISQAQAARAAAEEVRTQVRLGAAHLTPELRQFIDNAVAEGVATLHEESAGLEEFAPGGLCAEVCSAFRANLVEFIELSAELTDAVLESSGGQANDALSRLVPVVQAAPARVLYPLHRILGTTLASNLIDRMSSLASATAPVVQLVMEGGNVCGPMVEHADQVQQWTTGAIGVGFVLHVLGGA